jgi:hypothetical protein
LENGRPVAGLMGMARFLRLARAGLGEAGIAPRITQIKGSRECTRNTRILKTVFGDSC